MEIYFLHLYTDYVCVGELGGYFSDLFALLVLYGGKRLHCVFMSNSI